ncbi:MAG: DUF2970 domain-containing protein [Gammaproteobacteria bacterium]|nr:DUF2970 domain-containing protein [Gammaproteobacteria bacterium]
MSDPEFEKKDLSLIDVAKSTAMSFFGVQRGEIRERDFNKGKISHFIIAGLIFTILFIVLIYTIVRVILHNTGL